MFGEDAESIRARVTTLSELDVTACNMLSTACILLKDDDTAVHLLQRIRDHLSAASEPEMMYETHFFLDYFEDLLDILSAIESNGPIPEVRDYIREHYETLLYNKELLIGTLNRMKREDHMNKVRANYWKN